MAIPIIWCYRQLQSPNSTFPNFVTVDRIYLIEFEIIDTTDTYIALLLEIDNTVRLKENVMVLAN
jgi:hypothetical protein